MKTILLILAAIPFLVMACLAIYILITIFFNDDPDFSAFDRWDDYYDDVEHKPEPLNIAAVFCLLSIVVYYVTRKLFLK